MASDDWVKIKPTKVNIFKLVSRNPKHKHCDLIIHNSTKNPLYKGLYCCQHDHWFTWINPDQQHYLEQLGITSK